MGEERAECLLPYTREEVCLRVINRVPINLARRRW